MKIIYKISALLFLIFIECNFLMASDMNAEIIPQEKFARDFIEFIINGEFDNGNSMLQEDISKDESLKIMKTVHESIYMDSLKSVEKISERHTFFSSLQKGRTDYYMYEFEYSFSVLYLLFQITVAEKDGNLKIARYYVTANRMPLSELNSFTFRGKSVLNYIAFFFLIAVPVFILVTIVFIIRSKRKKKWLWILLSLFGLVVFNFNWNTGAFSVKLISILLLGASISKTGSSPWILGFAVPVAAIVFWLKQYELHKWKKFHGTDNELITDKEKRSDENSSSIE